MEGKKLLKNSILRIEKSLDETNKLINAGYAEDVYDDAKIKLINIMEDVEELYFLLKEKGFII